MEMKFRGLETGDLRENKRRSTLRLGGRNWSRGNLGGLFRSDIAEYSDRQACAYLLRILFGAWTKLRLIEINPQGIDHSRGVSTF